MTRAVIALIFLSLPSLALADLPESSPMHGHTFTAGKWNVMTHGNVFLRYNSQDAGESGARGGDKLDAPNWFMVVGNRAIGNASELTLTGMFSLDPLTVGGEGYPLLFQSGETWDGERLIDRQHPHDLFGELSAEYGIRAGGSRLFIYLGLPGEPALGPVVYLHRPSSGGNPDAPLGHHWQDASHVTFGVATAGIEYGPVGLAGSLFTGREPDEDRYDIDEPKLDSWSVRLSANPTKDTALQVSHGLLKSPETLEPDADINRTTASFLYNLPLGGGNFSTALIWGQNKAKGGDGLNSYLIEASYDTEGASPYGRAELVEKSGEDLGVGGHDDVFNVGALTLGSTLRLLKTNNLNLDFGAQGSAYSVDEGLRPVYGDSPFSVEVFLRLRPSKPRMEHMHGHRAWNMHGM